MKTMIKENPAIHVAKILLKQEETVDGRLSSCDIARACGLTSITVDSLEKKISRVEKSCGVIITPEYTRLGCNGGKTMIHLNISVDDIVKLQKFTPVSLKGIIAKEMGASVEEVKSIIIDPTIPQKKQEEKKEEINDKIKVSLEIEVSDLDKLVEAVNGFAEIDPQVLKIWERKKSLEEELKEVMQNLKSL